MHDYLDKSLQTSHRLQNIGIIDRFVRVFVGSFMIGVGFFYPMDSMSIWLAVLPLAGIIPLLSGILGWCPVYALFHTKSCGMDANNPCSTFPDQLLHLFGHHRR